MSRRIAGALAVVSLLAACTESQVAPDADIDLDGMLARQDGSPASGVPVVLTKGPDAIEVFATIASIGLACLDDTLPAACGRLQRSETGPDGRFAFQMRGRDTQGALGQASTLEVAAALPREGDQLDGAGATLRFMVQTEQMNLGVRLWETPIEAVGDGRRVAVRWEQPADSLFPPQADLSRVRTAVRFETGPGAIVWEHRPARSGDEIDARLIEDTRGSLGVHASIRGVEVPAEAGTRIDVLLRSPRYGYAARAGAPLSRGRPCSVPGPDGGPVAQNPCRLTDGEFEAALEPRTCPPGDTACVEPHHGVADIDLGAAEEITLVAVRGCPDRCTVEISLDGEAWTMLGSAEAEGEAGNFAVAPPSPAEARLVRIRAEGGVERLREVSVWDASPPAETEPASILLTIEQAQAQREAQREAVAGGGGNALLAAGALLLLAIAVLAVVLAARARRGGRARRAPEDAPPVP